jgi:hypothetical protein
MEFKNVEIVRPKMNFKQVIEKYGYPVISKEQAHGIHEVLTTKSEKQRNYRLYGDGRRTMGKISEKWKTLLHAPFKVSAKCCDVIKKAPLKYYERQSGQHPMIGSMADEGRRRKTNYMAHGCNAFESHRPMSMPLGFWLEQDVLRYLKDFEIPFCSVYGDIIELDGRLRTTGAERTGCMFCMFGVHLDGAENRFMRMQRTHPALWKYCIYDLGLKDVLNYIGVPYKNIFNGEEIE